MRLLITGALGHIGSRLIRRLPVGMFEEVVLLDNLATQRYPSLFELPDGIPFRFIEDDILTTDLDAYCDGMDAVIHLAALTNAEASAAIPEQVERTNFTGTERVAQACLRRGCRLIFISTTSVYGVQSEVVDEACPPDQLRPQSPYAESKLKAERLLQEWGASKGLEFVICRFGTIFGVSPGMRFHTAVNKFCWQAVMGQPLTVWRTAMHQHRPYLDLDDAVAALLFILQRDRCASSLYNVVTTNASVKEVVDLIAARVPEVSVRYVDSPIMNQLSYHVSNARVTRAGLTFRGSLERGITETIQWLKGARQGVRRDAVHA